MPRPTPTFADELRDALTRAVRGVDERQLARATEALVERYRAVAPAGAPILASAVHVLAYAAYRMPATHAALARLLAEVAASGFAPTTQLDLGGGTGAAAWAAAAAFPTLERITVLDQVDEALRLGRTLAADASAASLRSARFDRAVAGRWPDERVDLVTVSYVLSELDASQQGALVADAMARGRVVVVAEPGTPDGYARVLQVRDAFRDAGWTLLGPCPHAADCPLVQPDWCHFSARVNRSAEHRRLKGAELSYEDEKFSWVAAAAPGVVATQPDSPRILRHPLKRKGFVEFQACRPDGSAGREVVSKKSGDRYRAARDAEWGDPLPR
ncbi:small ribosomal subunit Rsm22 family protein [Intrasporangium sp. YIM S08009]|uniref:small ribosomal subunit Rsm22 family protein n=1 Tax=Intrasporangium zincisolvens TaxID=3080018 RepID=UPI002B0591EE|nr:small ribosomal subunit Rsm22 family protein [Intrasporangium sp. YIM S08009]